MRKEVYKAASIVCPMCDEEKCVGRSQCKQISDYLESKLVDFNQFKKASAVCTLESPVELGQKVYTIPRSAIREWTVAGVWISADPKCSYVHIYWEKNGHHMGSCAVNFSDISRCLFLSREEAEKALGERRLIMSCNQICRWNDPSDGCVKPDWARCSLSNMASPEKPKTNADRIRAMSDVELTEHEVRVSQDGMYYECSDGETFAIYEEAIAHESDWLQQPAEGTTPTTDT